MRQGMNMEQVRLKNRSAILNCINDRGAISRKDLADETGLTPAAVTQITNTFIEEGLLIELGQDEDCKSVGRKKILLDFNYKSNYVLGFSIESKVTMIVLSDMKGTIVESKEIETDTLASPESFLFRIAEIGKQMLVAHPRVAGKLAGVSVTIPGIIDQDKRVSEKAYGIWDEEVRVVDIFETVFHCKVHLENNVDAFAMAEVLFGKGREYANLLVIKWGPGVGASLTLNKQIYSGPGGKAVELGHYIVEENGKKCSCGRRGCLETVIRHSALKGDDDYHIEEFGDVFAQATGKKKADYCAAIRLFANCVVNTMSIIAPDRVVFCGKLIEGKEVQEEMIKQIASFDESVAKRVIFSELNEVSDYIGAIAAFVLQEIF